MNQINLKIEYNVNQLVISPSELINLYFFGIPMCTSKGEQISTKTIRSKILIAQTTLENFLDLKFKRQIIDESRDFVRNDFLSWGYIQAVYPVNKIYAVDGFINSVRQIRYPLEWISIRNTANKNNTNHRHIHIVPITITTPEFSSAVVYSGVSPHLAFLGLENIPNYWRIVYETGFNTVPMDIIDAVAKMAAIQIYALLGDIVFGPGIATSYLGFDGLNQSITTTASSENSLFGSKIRQFSNELKDILKRLKDVYKGVVFKVV